MDLQQLRYFVSVAEVENISLAAHSLRVAQSAVSRQIRLLEEELGTVLLQRAGRGVKLTDVGERFRHHASDLLKQADSVRADIRNRGSEPSGVLTIGANPSFGDVVFPPLAKSYSTNFPKVRLHFVTDMTMNIQEAMRKGVLDCGIVAFPDRDPSMASEAVASESVHLVSHRKNELGWGPVCTVKQLATVPLLLPGPWVSTVARSSE